jgi:hypothetical protein
MIINNYNYKNKNKIKIRVPNNSYLKIISSVMNSKLLLKLIYAQLSI